MPLNIQVGGLSDVALAFNKLSTTWRDAAAVTLNNLQSDTINQANITQLRQFHVRVPVFDLTPNPPPRGWRATQDFLQATIALAVDDGDPASLGHRIDQVFSKFGAAQEKVAIDPRQPIAIPTETLRPDINQLVPRGMYPKNLRLQQRNDVVGVLNPKARGSKRKLTITLNGITIKGDDRTFVLPNSFGKKSWGVWERFGSGRRAIAMIWKYEDAIAIPHRLNFQADSEAVLASQFQPRWDEAWQIALGNTQFPPSVKVAA